MNMTSEKTFVVTLGTAAALVVVSSVLLMTSRPAQATAQFAAQTGKSCADCHTDPKGGGALTALGDKFKANGNKMPK